MLPRDIRQRKYADHPTWWGYSDRDYTIMRGTAGEVEELMASEAKIGTAYTPTLVGKLAESAGRDLLPEWQQAKKEAYQEGMERGQLWVDTALLEDRGADYLNYLHLLGVAQAIANAGRDLVGVENIAAKANDVEGRKR